MDADDCTEELEEWIKKTQEEIDSQNTTGNQDAYHNDGNSKIKTEPLISGQLTDNLGDTWIIRCGNIIVPLASERARHF